MFHEEPVDSDSVPSNDQPDMTNGLATGSDGDNVVLSE